jgi:hypothetical protein
MRPARTAVRSAADPLAASTAARIAQARGDVPGAIHAFETAVEYEDKLAYIEPPSVAHAIQLYTSNMSEQAGAVKMTLAPVPPHRANHDRTGS